MQDTFAFDEGINREADTSGSGDTRPNRGHSVVGASRALAARWFGREDGPGCPQPAPAFEPIPQQLLAPLPEAAAEAAAIVSGCPAKR